jgi:hypothetical protein
MNKVKIILLTLLILVIANGLALYYFPKKGYFLFVYINDSSANIDRVAEVQSGFDTLQSCLKRGAPLAHCAKNCSI